MLRDNEPPKGILQWKLMPAKKKLAVQEAMDRLYEGRKMFAEVVSPSSIMSFPFSSSHFESSESIAPGRRRRGNRV
jgi:hypothetical protein